MPLINPLWVTTLRRHVLVFAAVALFAVFSLVHQLWFRPAARRYTQAVKQAAELGMTLDQNQNPRLVPPRLFALISQNTLPAREAQEGANSGSLTAEFIGDLSQLMGHRGVQVLSTEPGPMTQDPRSIQVRAHVRVRCRYDDFIGLLDDMAQDQRLIAVDRFSAVPDPAGTLSIEMWASRYLLKSGRS